MSEGLRHVATVRSKLAESAPKAGDVAQGGGGCWCNRWDRRQTCSCYTLMNSQSSQSSRQVRVWVQFGGHRVYVFRVEVAGEVVG